MKFCWTRAYLLLVRCPIDGVEEKRSTNGRWAQAVAKTQRKRLFEYFDYTTARAGRRSGSARPTVRPAVFGQRDVIVTGCNTCSVMVSLSMPSNQMSIIVRLHRPGSTSQCVCQSSRVADHLRYAKVLHRCGSRRRWPSHMLRKRGRACSPSLLLSQLTH
jgi:hypothetical protein